MFHVFEVVGASHVRDLSVVVVSEVIVGARALVHQIVGSFPRPEISCEFPADKRTGGSLVPLIQSLAAEVVMLPAPHHLASDRVEIVPGVPAGVVVVVVTPEAVRGISSLGLCSSDGGCTADVLLDVVLARQLGHVVDDLVVEV